MWPNKANLLVNKANLLVNKANLLVNKVNLTLTCERGQFLTLTCDTNGRVKVFRAV